MKEYVVTFPVVGFISYAIEVPDDVGSEKDARNAAVELAWVAYEEDETHSFVEWNAVERVTTGNVCHAPVNDISVEKMG